MSQDDQPVIVETASSPDAAVIWLHGLGADGHDFESVVPQLALTPDSRIRFIFPHAPVRPVTLNDGYAMRAWYDLYALGRGAKQDAEGLNLASAGIEQLIQQENQHGIPSERIVLMGFSQGGALALHAGLRYSQPLAGIGGLSTYLPVHENLSDERHASNHATPIFLAHGTFDPIIAFDIGTDSRDYLLAYGHPVDWHDYPMEHSLCGEEVDDIAGWLTQRLPVMK